MRILDIRTTLDCMNYVFLFLLVLMLASACGTSRSANCDIAGLNRYQQLAYRTLGRDIGSPEDEDRPDKETVVTLDSRVERCLVEDITQERAPLSDKAQYRLLAIRNGERRAGRGEVSIPGFTMIDVQRYYEEGLRLAAANSGLRLAFHHAFGTYLLAVGQGGKALTLLRGAIAEAQELSEPYYQIIIRDALASAYALGGQLSQRNVQRCEAIHLASLAYGFSQVRALSQDERDWTHQPACIRGTTHVSAEQKHHQAGAREREAHLAVLLHFIEDLASERRVAAIRVLLPQLKQFIAKAAPEALQHIGYFRTAEALALAGDGPGALNFLRGLQADSDMSATVEYDCYLGRVQLHAGQFAAALESLKECERYASDAERISPFLKQDIGLAYLHHPATDSRMIDSALTYLRAVQPQILALRGNYDPATRAAFFNSTVHWSFWGEILALLRKNSQPDESAVEHLLAKVESVRARQFRELRSGAEQEIPDHLPLHEIKHRIGQDGILLSYLLMDSQLLLIAVTADSAPLVSLRGVGNLNGEIDSLNRKMASFQTDETELTQDLHELSRKLLKSVWPLLRGKKEVFVIPDGKVGLIPFDLLLSGEDSPKSLLDEEYNVRLLPSLTTFLEPEQASSPSGVVPFLVGNLTYRSANPLPHTKDEIRTIEHLLHRQQLAVTDRILQSDQATHDTVLAGLSNASVHHLATHAYVSQLSVEALDQPDGDEPALLLSGSDTLRASEIVSRGRWLNADLTVLSACQTAIGPYQVGEGLLGLGRAFLIAGSRKVLVSLWPVSDSATAKLMEAFYRGYLSDRTKPWKALREAKMAIRDDLFSPDQSRTKSGTREPPDRKRRRHPYFWASFVLITVR